MSILFRIPVFVLTLIAAGPALAHQSVERIADELTVQRIPAEIEIAVDEKNWAHARSFFGDQIRVDFSTLSGQPAAMIAADDLIAAWSANLGPKKLSHHQRGHGLISFSGNTASIYSKGYAWNRMEGNGDPLWEVWGNYTHTLEKTAKGWKVTGMKFEMTHERGNLWVRNTPSPAQ